MDPWIGRYDIIFLSVTICVTLCYAMFMILFSMLTLGLWLWLFAWDIICMSSFTMNFCRNCWFISYLIDIFDCYLAILGFSLSSKLPYLVKCSFLTIWMWNLVECFLTCLASHWLWSHSFPMFYFCFTIDWSWHLVCDLV